MAYNKEHGIVPKTIVKKIGDVLEISAKSSDKKIESKLKLNKKEAVKLISDLTKEMKAAAKILEFEHAAVIRDKIEKIKKDFKID